MVDYSSITRITEIESKRVPEELLKGDVESPSGNNILTTNEDTRRVQNGYEASLYVLPTPREGIRLVDSSDELSVEDAREDYFYKDSPEIDGIELEMPFINMKFGRESEGMLHNKSETKGSLKSSFLKWFHNQEGLSYTSKRSYRSNLSDQSEYDDRDVSHLNEEFYNTNSPFCPNFQNEGIHARPQQQQQAGAVGRQPLAYNSASYLGSPQHQQASFGPPRTSGGSHPFIHHSIQSPATSATVQEQRMKNNKRVKSVKRGSFSTSQNPSLSKKTKVKKKMFGMGIIKLLLDFWPLTLLMIFIPVGCCSAYFHWGPATTFILNFLAIVPMAWLIGQCTEDVASKLGQVYGGLVNAWMGNVVEMVLIIAALKHNEVVVVRATLIGSILSNILLVAGCSFFFGGLKYKVQEFNTMSAGILCSLLMFSVLCLGLPTVYNTVLEKADADLLNISRVLSFFLITVYGEFMFFQLYTHAFLFDGEDDEEDVYLSLPEAVLTLSFASVVCAVCSEFLIRSIDGTVKSLSLSKEFIGIILLPIIGNAAEHYTAVVVSMKNKMDLSVGCAIGSSVQMSLLVTPFSVLCGWAMGVPMTLDLHPYELMVLLASILTVQTIIHDGKTNWLEGALLCTAYLVIALIYFLEDPKYSDLL